MGKFCRFKSFHSGNSVFVNPTFVHMVRSNSGEGTTIVFANDMSFSVEERLEHVVKTLDDASGN